MCSIIGQQTENELRKVRVTEADWAALVKPVPVDDRLRNWFGWLDPRPESAFTPFTNEILEKKISEDANSWCFFYFTPRANPFKCGLKGPGKYSLAPEPGRKSLLRYEWVDAHYRFVLLEGYTAMLLEVRQANPPPGRVWSGIWPRETILEIMRVCLNEEICAYPGAPVGFKKIELQPGELSARWNKWMASFRLPDRLQAGELFTNSEDSLPWPNPWPPHVLGVLGKDVIRLMVLKEYPWGKTWPLDKEATWLPVHLYEADGKVLVIERQWGRAYPQEK